MSMFLSYIKKSSLLFLILGCALGLSAQTLYRFEKNGKYGFKNAENAIIVQPIYKFVSDDFTSLGGVCNDEGWAVINNRGQRLTGFVYSGGVGKAKGFDLIPVYNSYGFMGVNHSYGIVNKKGTEIAKPAYGFIEIISNDLAIVANYGKYGILNSANRLVLPMDYAKESLKVFTNIQPNGVFLQNNQWKAFSFAGADLQKWKYDDILVEGEYLWPVKYRNKWGFVDKLGVELVKPEYDSTGIFREGIAWVAKAGKKGILDNHGKLVLPVQYDHITKHGAGNYLVLIDKKVGLLSDKGNEILPVKYSYIDQFAENLAAVQLDNNWGFVDASGKQVIPNIYEGALPFSEGMAAVMLNKKVGFINKEGKILIEPQFEDVTASFYKGKAIVVRDGKEIYIDAKGKDIK